MKLQSIITVLFAVCSMASAQILQDFSTITETRQIDMDGNTPKFRQLAVPRILKPTFPKYSDVSMRTLTIRDVPTNDEKDIFSTAPALHATRIDWSYIWFTERELDAVKKIQQLGYTYCGSAAQHIPCWIGDRAPADWLENIIMTDIDGNPSIMPFIRPWKNPQLIGDISNPVYYKGHLEYYKKLILAGCDVLMRDAPDHHYLAVTTCGGGFTETGVAGFRKWLASHIETKTLSDLGIQNIYTFDYRDYLREKKAPTGDDFSRAYNGPLKKYWYQYWEHLTIKFFSNLTHDCKAYAKRDIPFANNNGSFQKWDALQQLFDLGMSELMMVSANPKHLRNRLLVTEELGKFQIIGSAKMLGLEVHHNEKTALDNKVIATLYANGALPQAPWDTFEQTKDGSGRFYGKPADYAPAYGFARGIAPYLDNYERAFDFSTSGILTAGIRPAESPLQINGTENEVCAFVRVNPNADNTPIAIHLIDWGKPLINGSTKPVDDKWELASGETIYEYVRGMENIKRSPAHPFELVLSTAAFSTPADQLTFKLLSPCPYDPQAHATAEQQKDYSPLVAKQNITAEIIKGEIHLNIPALRPWGLLIAEPE